MPVLTESESTRCTAGRSGSRQPVLYESTCIIRPFPSIRVLEVHVWGCRVTPVDLAAASGVRATSRDSPNHSGDSTSSAT